MVKISADLLDILQHSLGLNKYGEGKQYRNHYVAGADDAAKCRELVAMGYMAERPSSELTGGDPLFHVTPAGVAQVALQSPKLSRGQMVNGARIEAMPAEAFTIYDAPTLDPITVVTQDIGPGAGRIIVECFGEAWSAYFGAMYTDKIGAFLASVSADYLASKLWPSSQRRTKRREQYLSRIVEVVIDALKQQRFHRGENKEPVILG